MEFYDSKEKRDLANFFIIFSMVLYSNIALYMHLPYGNSILNFVIIYMLFVVLGSIIKDNNLYFLRIDINKVIEDFKDTKLLLLILTLTSIHVYHNIRYNIHIFYNKTSIMFIIALIYYLCIKLQDVLEQLFPDSFIAPFLIGSFGSLFVNGLQLSNSEFYLTLNSYLLIGYIYSFIFFLLMYYIVKKSDHIYWALIIYLL
ncbi:hypothetical protein [Marinitoga lauensis]|uniref:hypothetical protein n=1 Tax=Marinitoga lauensis TaxID=2201189 RepID=UPI001012D0BA|nr:hypothetical protein [Marinitoga lauensis]